MGAGISMVINIGPPTGHVPDPNQVLTEYPKFVHRDGLPSVIVQNSDEEAALLAGSEPKAQVHQPESVTAAPLTTLQGVNDEREILLKLAQERGIKVDGRWSTAKIRKAIKVANG